MSEQAQQGATSACPHPEAMGIRWSDPISADRQAALRARLADRVRTAEGWVPDLHLETLSVNP